MRKGTLILLTAILALCLTCALTGGIAMAYVENYHELEAPIAPMEEGEFSLIVMGDTQCVVEDNPQYLVNTNNWIRDNAQALNLAYVMHMGDMVDDIETTQFESARAAMSILDDAGVPYSLVLGNHDYLGYANSDRNYTMYDSYFPLAAYESMPTFGGSMDGSTMENTYHLFTAGGEDYLLLAIGYKPLNATLDWCCQIVEQYPERKVIVTTHSYLYANGTINSVGERIWERFVSKYENIFMVLCGHEIPDEGVYRDVYYGSHGNKVNVLMVNHQYFENGGVGNILTMRFRLNGDIECHTYCPSYDLYLNSSFTLREDDDFPDPMHGDDLSQMPLSVQEGSVLHDFVGLSEGDERWRDQVYALKNCAVGLNGLTADGGTGYLIDAVALPEGKVFTDLNYRIAGELAAVQLYYSYDGSNYFIAKSWQQESEGSFSLRNLTAGCSCIFVKTVFASESVIASIELTAEDLKVQPQADSTGLSLVKTFAGLDDYDTTSWSQEAVEVVDILTFGGRLGTGKQSSYAGAEGYILYLFRAPEGAVFESLSFSAAGSLTGTDMGYALRVHVGGDRDRLSMAADEKVSQVNFSKTYDLTAQVRGLSEVWLQIGMYGNYWTSVCLNSYEISGSYRYNLSYETYGSENSADNPSSYVYGDRTNLSAPQSLENCDFGGWYLDESFTDGPIASLDGLSGARTLYARWIPRSYRIIYSLGGGKNSAANPAVGLATEELVLSAPTRTGYTFGGWFDENEEEWTSLPVGRTEDVNLTAKWYKNAYIVYQLNGGTNAEDNPASYAEGLGHALEAPVKDGAVFEGWYLESDFSGEPIEAISAEQTGQITLYAKWSDQTGGKTGCGAASAGVVLAALWALGCLKFLRG